MGLYWFYIGHRLPCSVDISMGIGHQKIHNGQPLVIMLVLTPYSRKKFTLNANSVFIHSYVAPLPYDFLSSIGSLQWCHFWSICPIHFHYMKKSSSDILQNISFCVCVSQKKERHIGLEWDEDE